MSEPICAKCGLTEAEHHAFTPSEKPVGCVCEAKTWGDPRNIPVVCKEFDGAEGEYCATCEHDKACHQ